MDSEELKRIILSLNEEQKKELVKQLIELKNDARGCILSTLGWKYGYKAVFERKDLTISRNIMIVCEEINCSDDIENAIKCSAKNGEHDRIFNRLECYIFNGVDDAKSLNDIADYQYQVILSILDIDAIVSEVLQHEAVLRIVLPDTKDTEKKYFISKQDKIIFDLFTTGAKVADIKYSFVSSYIQLALYDKDKMSPMELRSRVKKNLKNLTEQVYDATIEIERSAKRVDYDGTYFSLSCKFREDLDNIVASTSQAEELLHQQFKDCLGKYGLVGISKEVMGVIMAMYKAYYDGELRPFSSEDKKIERERKLYNKLLTLLCKTGISQDDARQVSKEILDVVGDSEYLNKTALTGMFTSMFNSDELESYMDKQQRVVFLDTQILLRYLCLLYQDTGYKDIAYDSVKILFREFEDAKVQLYTTTNYIDEVVNHLYESNSLSRFLSLPYIIDMGPSRNVFFNFYLHLKDEENMTFDGFDDFLSQMLDYEDVIPKDYNGFMGSIYQVVSEIFINAGISIVNVQPPENMDEYHKVYIKVLEGIKIKNKGFVARTNDILCSIYLSEESNFINTETDMAEMPFLISLDRSMYPFRDAIVHQFKRNNYYVYPPVKFANRLSVMNLKLDSEKINYNIIQLTENNFNASTDTLSMMDTISQIMSGVAIDGKTTPQKLAALKRTQMDDVKIKDFAIRNHNNTPIDIVLNDVSRYYRRQSQAKYQLLGRVFQNNDLTDQLVKILKEGCSFYLMYQEVNDKIYKEIDSLMKMK